MRRAGSKTVAVAALAALAGLSGCDQAREFLAGEAARAPAAEEVAPYYASHGGIMGIEMRGNVVEIHVVQPVDQLDRGGSLWARVGPYVYLMTPATRQLFEDHAGVAAVRVITHLPGGEEVARAMLRRDALSDVRWRRTLNILGHALQDGQASPRQLERLTDWGEAYTEYSYNPRYVNR